MRTVAVTLGLPKFLPACYAVAMGDRTTTRTTVAAADFDAVKDVLFGKEWRDGDHGFAEEDRNEDGTITFTMHDVNYGGEYDADNLQKAGIPFVVEHDAGGSYPHGWIVFDGQSRGSFYGCDGGLMIAFDEATGEADTEDVARAREFVALRRRTFDVIARRTVSLNPASDRERC